MLGGFEMTFQKGVCAALALSCAVVIGGCVQDVKENRVKSALMSNGVSEPNADCMSRRMAERLSVHQLQHLSRLSGEKHTWQDYVSAVDRVNDPEALKVLVTSYGLCRAGFIR